MLVCVTLKDYASARYVQRALSAFMKWVEGDLFLGALLFSAVYVYRHPVCMCMCARMCTHFGHGSCLRHVGLLKASAKARGANACAANAPSAATPPQRFVRPRTSHLHYACPHRVHRTATYATQVRGMHCANGAGDLSLPRCWLYLQPGRNCAVLSLGAGFALSQR